MADRPYRAWSDRCRTAVPGGPALDWVALQREVGDALPLFLYDRGGLGWSDPAPWPRTATTMANELHQTLHAAEVAPPYVLAGNSSGGLIARMFLALYPEHVAGLILIDSSHEDQMQRLSVPGERRRDVWGYRRRAARYLLTWNGVRRAAVEVGLRPKFRRDAELQYVPEVVAAAVATSLTSSHRRAAAQELLGVAPSMTPDTTSSPTPATSSSTTHRPPSRPPCTTPSPGPAAGGQRIAELGHLRRRRPEARSAAGHHRVVADQRATALRKRQQPRRDHTGAEQSS
ncbi:MAG: alpha/beta hydrolase [Cryobacterium sp.]|nr:alpha/beta hydrolase [Cryobacterium sp.]